MKEILTVDKTKDGTKVAIVKVADSDSKYELCVAWCFNEETCSWGQGHYFTLWYDEITPMNKINLLTKASQYYSKEYLQ